MDFNKDLIVRVLLALAIFMAFITIVLPVFIRGMKNKFPGSDKNEDGIDFLIKKQKERIKSKYGIQEVHELREGIENKNADELPDSAIIKEALKEVSWGGGKLNQDVKASLSKNYSYTMSDSKINAFFLMAKKRNYFNFLDAMNAQNHDAIVNFLTTSLALHLIVEEIRQKDLNFTEMMAKKRKLPPMVLAIALQIKILSLIKFESPLRDEKKFTGQLALSQYSEESVQSAVDKMLKKEANLWAKDQSSFIEELNLFTNYAQILKPFPPLKNKNDLEAALFILGLSNNSTLEDAKKNFKRLAQEYHPDKILQKSLPPYLTVVCTKKFNIIREAYDIVCEKRK